MSHVLLEELARENFYLVFDGTIYHLDNDSFSSDQYLKINQIQRSLSKASSLNFFEKNRYKKQLNDKLSKLEQEVINKNIDLKKELSNFSIEDENKYLKFIREFMDEISRKLNVRTHQANNGYKELIFDKNKIEKTLFKNSLFSKIFQNENFFIMGNTVFKLAHTRHPSSSHHIKMNGLCYNLNSFSTLNNFVKEYSNGLNVIIKNLSEEQRTLIEKHKQDEIKRHKELLTIRKKVGDFGWKSINNEYYIYKTVDSVTYRSKIDNGTNFIFPSVKIGLKLILKNNKIVVDDSFETGRCRILEAKDILNGKEVGDFKSMRHKPFIHPAYTSTQGKYPYICFTGDPFSNYSASEIISMLNDVHIRYQRGYNDNDGSATLYQYLDDESHRMYFFNNRINKKDSRYRKQ